MIDFERMKRGVQRRDFAISPARRRAKRNEDEEKKEDESTVDSRQATDEEEEKKEDEERSLEDEEDEWKKEDEERSLDDEDEEKKEDESTVDSRQSTAEEEEQEEKKEEELSLEDDERQEEEEIEDELKKEEEELGRRKRMIVEGYATTFDTPYQLMREGGAAVFERMERSAFDGAQMTDVVLQYDHAGRVYARMSNGTLELSVDAHGLKVRADLSGTAAGRRLYEEIRGGYTTKMSIGFTIDESDVEEVTEEDVLGFRTGSSDIHYLHTIRKIGRVYDVSAVSLPANEGTAIEARSLRIAGGGSLERDRLLLEIDCELAMAAV